MFDPNKQAAVRLGDSTSHGGKVITATSRYILHGIAIAKAGDMTHCPKCKGDFAILPTPGASTDDGVTIAHDGTLTACGAILVSSFVRS
jgi:uncharacterized Zn-binding protein involved in type VI secretion